ncbi:MAG: glutathione S-transferase, partial [Myxococcales bacterium]|nr:glutathione S-transferase [Myxococcales bacterium]
FDALSERALAAGRALGLPKVLLDREALEELVPRKLRSGAIRPAATRLAALGVQRTIRKYGANRVPAREHQRVLREALAEIRATLKPTADGPATLLGTFSYADITASQVIQFIAPKNRGAFRIGAASMRVYQNDELAEEFTDVIDWCDQLYERYRDGAA